MKRLDFPSLYQASDAASNSSQKNYLRVIIGDLICMIAGAVLAVYSFNSELGNTIIYCFSGLFLLISLILTIILKTKSFENFWYDGRALAESVKTLTWRFVCCSELFEITLSPKDADERFVTRINDLSKEFKDLCEVLNSDMLTRPIITERMRQIRSLPLNDRKKLYIKERIQDQKDWYSKKATYNNKKYNIWFVIVVVCQFLSLVGIVLLIKNPMLSWNAVGLFTTVSAAALSWTQTKQYQELNRAYTTAVQELNSIEALAQSISSEDQLSRFILDSENAISREHTLWLAQRRK